MTTDAIPEGSRPAPLGEATPTHRVDARPSSYAEKLTGTALKEERPRRIPAATIRGATRTDDETRARRDAPPTEKGSRGACGDDRAFLEQLAAELQAEGHRAAPRDPFPATGTGAPPSTTQTAPTQAAPPSTAATHAKQRRWQWKEALRRAGPDASSQDVRRHLVSTRTSRPPNDAPAPADSKSRRGARGRRGKRTPAPPHHRYQRLDGGASRPTPPVAASAANLPAGAAMPAPPAAAPSSGSTPATPSPAAGQGRRARFSKFLAARTEAFEKLKVNLRMHLEKGARLADLHRKARERAERDAGAARGREHAARDELTGVLKDASAYRNSLREAQATFEGSARSILAELSQVLLEARGAAMVSTERMEATLAHLEQNQNNASIKNVALAQQLLEQSCIFEVQMQASTERLEATLAHLKIENVALARQLFDQGRTAEEKAISRAAEHQRWRDTFVGDLPSLVSRAATTALEGAQVRKSLQKSLSKTAASNLAILQQLLALGAKEREEALSRAAEHQRWRDALSPDEKEVLNLHSSLLTASSVAR
jgi:hypothetical protein